MQPRRYQPARTTALYVAALCLLIASCSGEENPGPLRGPLAGREALLHELDEQKARQRERDEALLDAIGR